jgi:hypothetical protein
VLLSVKQDSICVGHGYIYITAVGDSYRNTSLGMGGNSQESSPELVFATETVFSILSVKQEQLKYYQKESWSK